MSRAAAAEWREVGSELEALLREAALIHELQPPVNVQTGAPGLETRAVPRALVRDILVIAPSVRCSPTIGCSSSALTSVDRNV